MTLTLSAAARNAGCDAVVDLVDQGAGAGKLKIKQSTTVLVTITMAATAGFGAASVGVATAQGGDDTNPISGGNPLTAVAGAAGTADNYDVTDSNDVVLWSGTVTGTGGGGDMELDNTNIANGQTINITSWTHTVPAS